MSAVIVFFPGSIFREKAQWIREKNHNMLNSEGSREAHLGNAVVVTIKGRSQLRGGFIKHLKACNVLFMTFYGARTKT